VKNPNPKSSAPTPRNLSESKRRASGGGGPTPVKASLELALLGLIAAAPRICGYDISRIFNLSMRHFWHAHPGQIYPTLARMERAGWISSHELIQRGRPNKRVFAITATGRAALELWLESPYENLKLKHAPLLKTLYLGHLGADRALAKFAEQRGGCVAYLEELRGIEREFFAQGGYGSRHRMFSYFTLRYGIGFMEESIRWCDWAMEEIERNRSLFSADSDQAHPEQRQFARRSTGA
jgi:DNA-binding PadR family transcriptional regulator